MPLRCQWIAIAVLASGLAACQPATPTPAGAPTTMPKQLATVYISPTPDDAERQATQVAVRPSATIAPTEAPPSPTPYIGIFLGEANNPDGGNLSLPDQTFLSNLPTEAAPACPIEPAPDFGSGWSSVEVVRQTLDCALELMVTFEGSGQVFERGVMYWRRSTGEVWAIATGGALGGSYWHEERPPTVEETPITAPEGLRVPEMGFGAVWRGIGGVREALGFARTEEQATLLSLQRFQGGWLLRETSSGQVFALMNDGTAYGPY